MFELNGGVRWETQQATFPRAAAGRRAAGNRRARPRCSSCRRSATRSCSPTASARCSSRSQDVSLYAAYGNAKTPSSATVRLGCGRARWRRADRRRPCAVAPETAQNYEVGRQGRAVRPAPAADRRGVPQRAHQFPRRLQRSGAADRDCRCSTGAAGSTASRWARRATSRQTGRSSPTTPISTARCCQASPTPASPTPERRMRQFGGDARSAARRRADPDAEAFGQPVHHLQAAVRAGGRLWPDLSGQLRAATARRWPQPTQFGRTIT